MSDRDQQIEQIKSQQLMEAVQRALFKGRYVFVDCFEGPFTSFVTSRLGGQSAAPFDSFNMAYHVGDNPLNVARNRQQVRDDFGFQHLCFMDQNHTNQVMIVDENNVEQEVFPCDGIVTKLKGVALAVMTADCLPLMMCDEEQQVVAAVHCGWRGIASGIIANAVEKMVELGAQRERIVTYLGPAIGPRSFVVGDDVRDIFVQQYAPYAEAFVDRMVVNPELPSVAPTIASSAFSIEGTSAVLQGRIPVNLANPDPNSLEEHKVSSTTVTTCMTPSCSLSNPMGAPLDASLPETHMKTDTTIMEVVKDPVFGEIKYLKIEGKHLCNIYELAVLTLQRSGAVGYVYGGRFDTFAQSTLFYSYRKAHVTGRMASVIAINA